MPIRKVAEQLGSYLERFDQIVTIYRQWSERRPEAGSLLWLFQKGLKGRPERLGEELMAASPATVFDAYNLTTHHATHQMRSARSAFDLLERINLSFQKSFPISRN